MSRVEITTAIRKTDIAIRIATMAKKANHKANKLVVEKIKRAIEASAHLQRSIALFDVKLDEMGLVARANTGIRAEMDVRFVKLQEEIARLLLVVPEHVHPSSDFVEPRSGHTITVLGRNIEVAFRQTARAINLAKSTIERAHSTNKRTRDRNDDTLEANGQLLILIEAYVGDKTLINEQYMALQNSITNLFDDHDDSRLAVEEDAILANLQLDCASGFTLRVKDFIVNKYRHTRGVDESCKVCLADFVPTTIVVKSFCGHLFCVDCLAATIVFAIPRITDNKPLVIKCPYCTRCPFTVDDNNLFKTRFGDAIDTLIRLKLDDEQSEL